MLGTACNAPTAVPIYIHHDDDQPPGLQIAVDDLVAHLEVMGGQAVIRKGLPAPDCRRAQTHIVILAPESEDSDGLVGFSPVFDRGAG